MGVQNPDVPVAQRDLFDYPDTPVYNTKAVAVRTGVPADTFRAWERRYGVPKPRRGEGSQRLYSERDVASIRWLRQQTETGLSIKQAVALLRAAEQMPPEPAPTAPSGSLEDAARRVFNALVGLDTPHADRLLSECFARYGVESTCLNVIQPVMYRIGEEWAAGNLPVSVEHFCSYFIRSKLTALVDAYGQSGTLGPVITACAPGEQHEMGLLMLALFLLRRGIRVVHLGADLPIDELAYMAQRVRPQIICLSASIPSNAGTVAKSAGLFTSMNGARPRISCGGAAFFAEPELKEQIEDLPLGPNALLAAEEIHRLVSQPRNPTGSAA